MTGMADMGDFHPSVLSDSEGLAVQGPSFDEIYPFGFPGSDSADATQADALFDFSDFDFDQKTVQGIDSSCAISTTPESSIPEQRYVSPPSQSETHPASVWRPIEKPVEQFQYPDPDFSLGPSSSLTPYYPLQPLPSANTMTQHDFRAITPPGQQISSLDRPLFLHGNMGPPPAAPGLYSYEPIPTYSDNAAFNPEDLALSDIPGDMLTTAINEGWTLPTDNAPPRSQPDDLSFLPNNNGTCNPPDFNDADYKPKRARRTKSGKPQRILPNGAVKKGRPCAKPQTEERLRVNQRRMEGYYRRKFEQGNLEKARQQSKESYWRRKQRRIEAGEKVRSYNTEKKGKSGKGM